LYTSGGWYGQFIHQFNLISYDSISVANSKYIVFTDTSVTSTTGFPSALQIGPDGKIYNATNTQALNVIDSPNQYGSSCNFQLNSLQLSLDSCWFAASQHGLPNNDESFYLNSFTGLPCNPITLTNFNTLDSCVGSPASFFDSSNFFPFAINNWSWDFGDPSSGSLNYSQLKNPQHTYSSTGLYQVKLIAYSDTFYLCKVDSVTKTINLNCVTGITQTSSLDNYVNIIPNPASNFLQIESPVNITGVNIFNAQGQLVYSKKDNFNITKIELNLDCGLYILELFNDNSKARKKIIINNSP
jgi:hypothetical protein